MPHTERRPTGNRLPSQHACIEPKTPQFGFGERPRSAIGKRYTKPKSNGLPHDAHANKMDNAFRWGGA